MAKQVNFGRENLLCNRLRERRLQLGMTQEALAGRARVARQTVSGIEAGQYGPSLSVALRIAQSLNAPVDSLFWLPPPEAKPGKELIKCIGPVKKGSRVRVINLSQGLVAYPLSSQDIFQEANGIVLEIRCQDSAWIKIFNPEPIGRNTLILAGCSPALAVLMRKLERLHRDMFISWVPLNSLLAIKALRDELVQVAGSHFFDEQSGEYNLPVIQRMLRDKEYTVYSLCLGEQGLLVRKKNPKRIASIGDLTRSDISLVNREQGAEARRLLDTNLRENEFSPEQVRGYSFEVNTHLDVAHAVALGAADCGIVMKSVALYFDLDFISLARERYDLVFLKKDMENPGIQALLELLHSMPLKRELEAYGYDPSVTGTHLYDSN